MGKKKIMHRWAREEGVKNQVGGGGRRLSSVDYT